MSEPRKSRRRRQELEPLTYEEAANSPALTGLVSFLGLQPTDVAARAAARTAAVDGHHAANTASLPFPDTAAPKQPFADPGGLSTTGPYGPSESRGRLIELTAAGMEPDQNGSAFNAEHKAPVALSTRQAVVSTTTLEIHPLGLSTPDEYQKEPEGVSTSDQINPEGLSDIPSGTNSNSFNSNEIEVSTTTLEIHPLGLSTPDEYQKEPEGVSTPDQINPEGLSDIPSSTNSNSFNSNEIEGEHQNGDQYPEVVSIPGYISPEALSPPHVGQNLPVAASTPGQTSNGRTVPPQTSKAFSAPEPPGPKGDSTLGVGYIRPVGVSTSGFLPGVGRSAVYKASLAQDGHSLGEQAVYEVLWREGKADKPRMDTEDPWAARYVSLGYAEVAAKARINKKSAKLNLQRLIEKQAIEVTSEYIKETSSPRTYRVLSYREIVDRRRRAGMVWVVRNKAVTFVTPEGMPLGMDPLGPSTTGMDIPSRSNLGFTHTPGGLVPTAGVAHAATAPGVETPTHINREVFLDNSLGSKDTTTTTTFFSGFDLVVKAMSEVGYADHTAVVQLVEDCSAIVPDVTAEEICEFVQAKKSIVAGSSTIKNPIGFLLATVPKCFVGKTFLEHREQKRLHAEKLRLEAEAEAQRLETVAKQAVDLITESSFSEELKRRIRSEFIADPYRPLASYLSEDERAQAGRVWNAIRDRLQSLLNVQVFQTWFRPLKGFKYHDGTLKIVVPVREFMNLEERYSEQLNQAVDRARSEVAGLGALKRLQFFDGSEFRI